MKYLHQQNERELQRIALCFNKAKRIMLPRLGYVIIIIILQGNSSKPSNRCRRVKFNSENSFYSF